MTFLLGDFNAEVVRELTIQNENLHEISNDNGIRLVNLATSKNSHRNFYKYIL
jgi:hypothetical protein